MDVLIVVIIRAISFLDDKKLYSSSVLSQIRYSLVVILKLNSGSEVQYKDMMMVDDGKYQ